MTEEPMPAEFAETKQTQPSDYMIINVTQAGKTSSSKHVSTSNC